MRGEGSDRHIAKKIAHAHDADPEKEHGPGIQFLLLCLRVEQTAGDIRDSVSYEDSGNSNERRQWAVAAREDWIVIDVFIDIGLPEDIAQTQVSVVERKRIGLVMNDPGREAVRILMHQVTNCMGKPKLDENERPK